MNDKSKFNSGDKVSLIKDNQEYVIENVFKLNNKWKYLLVKEDYQWLNEEDIQEIKEETKEIIDLSS